MQAWRSAKRWTMLLASSWVLICLLAAMWLVNAQHQSWKATTTIQFLQSAETAARLVSAMELGSLGKSQVHWKELQSELDVELFLRGQRVGQRTQEESDFQRDFFSRKLESSEVIWRYHLDGWLLETDYTLPTREGEAQLRVSRTVPPGDTWRWQIGLAIGTLGMIGGIALILALLLPASQWSRIQDAFDRWTSQSMSLPPEGRVPDLEIANLPDEARLAAGRLQAALKIIDQHWTAAVESNRQSAEIFQGMLVGVMTFDEQLKLQFANRAAVSLLGIHPSQLAGRSVLELIRQPKVAKLLQQSLESPSDETSQVLEEELELGSKPPLSLRLRASRWQMSEGSGVMMTISDETRLRQLENMRREFTTNVSHELKTPLAAVKAYTETLLMGALEDPAYSRRFVERIAEQSSKLERLIHDLIQLARIQDSPELPKDWFPLATCMAADLEAMRAVAESKQVRLHCDPLPDGCMVHTNREAIDTILSNLLSNAIRYNSAGGEVFLHAEVGDGRLVLSVRDTGIGIASEHHDRVFERFYRVDKARSTDEGSTGLGLAIVRNLAQSLGGKVVLSSEPGRGSTFCVSIPAESCLRQDFHGTA